MAQSVKTALMDHKDIGIALFLVGLAIFFLWAARAFVVARRREREQLATEATAEAAAEAAAEADAVERPEPEGHPQPQRVPKAEVVEPVVVEPVKVEPVVVEPVKVEPAVVEPVVAEPAVVEPVVVEPAAVEPAAALPVVVEPVKVEPAVALPKLKPKVVPRVEPAVPKPKELKVGLKKTRGGFIAKLGGLFHGKKKFDDGLMDELEEVLFTADIGVRTSETLFQKVKEALDRKQLRDADAVWATIKEEAQQILTLEAPPLNLGVHKPFVILTVGVNGVGKTTTIGKLAAKYQAEGRRCLLAAGDTFRAAAVEQLEVWGVRVDAPVVRGKEGQDPSSVIFDAIKEAERGGYDVVICDTAGRLHTKVSLMEELQKIFRVSGKALDGAPHEVLLVLDATTGQNAIQQANLFKEAVQVTGIALTKLDGTAKGGIILGICDEMRIPVRYIGIGEGVEDLREFDAAEFVEALFAPTEEADF